MDSTVQLLICAKLILPAEIGCFHKIQMLLDRYFICYFFVKNKTKTVIIVNENRLKNVFVYN